MRQNALRVGYAALGVVLRISLSRSEGRFAIRGTGSGGGEQLDIGAASVRIGS